MSFASAVAVLLALARALPALEQLLRIVVAQRDREREAQAVQRRQEKDSAVDAAIDAPRQVSPGRDNKPAPQPGRTNA